MYRRINGKTIISILLCLGILFMAVGYSMLSNNLEITAGASITTTWDVRITKIITKNISGSAYNIDEPDFTNDTARFSLALTDPGDSITYTITIENKGTLAAILNSLDITTNGTSQIIYEVTGIKEGDILTAGNSVEVTVVARYNSNATEAPEDAGKSLEFGLNWIQYANQSINAGTYTINYNANGGSGSMSGTTCTVGSNCTLRTNTFTRSGYKFLGWSTDTLGAHVYTDGQSVKNLTSSGKTITLYAMWEEEPPKLLVETILTNNIAYADNVSSPYVSDSTGIDFYAISSDTNGKGLYYTSTNTEDNKTTYYFRGAVENNYVKFGKDSSGNDILWRIVRINEDGSIRLITQDIVGSSEFNVNYNDNAHVGYMYGTVGSSTYAATHKNINNSTIKGVIDDWYVNDTNLSNYVNSHLADAGFCNDRSVAPSAGLWYSRDTALGYGKNMTYYGAYNRLYENTIPQFACPNAKNDLFTTVTSTKGNKALTNPIGLLTADEVWYAGATRSTNLRFYLNKKDSAERVNYWTMTPRYFSGSYAYGGMVKSGGGISDLNYLNKSYAVRPVINLQSGVEIISGDGTSGNPYIIKTN